MRLLIIAAFTLAISVAASAWAQSDSFSPTDPPVDWARVDRKALGDRLDKLRAAIAEKKKIAQAQSDAAKDLRKRHNASLPPPADPSREGYDSPANLDPVMVVARQRELAQLRAGASDLEASAKKIEAEITDLTWDEVKLGRDMRAAVQAMVKREQAVEDAQRDALKEAERVRKANEKAQAARDKQFQDAIETMAVTQSFQGLQSMVNDTNRTLDELERKYDQALLGAYMKDKMTTLLNSKAFCSAATNCELAAKDRKPVSTEMNEVFPWSDPKQARTPGPSKTTSK